MKLESDASPHGKGCLVSKGKKVAPFLRGSSLRPKGPTFPYPMSAFTGHLSEKAAERQENTQGTRPEALRHPGPLSGVSLSPQ